MNAIKARGILELPEKFDEALLKRNYRLLAIKYHPDKNKENSSGEKFKELNSAYKYLLNNDKNEIHLDSIFGDMFKTFTTQFGFSRKTNAKTIIDITAREYLTGTAKQIIKKKVCHCEQKLCLNCGGCGYSIGVKMKACMECAGDGYIKGCEKCKNGYTDDIVNINVAPRQPLEFTHPLLGPVLLKMEPGYFIKGTQLYSNYNISLKESLIGFNKTFKDPFGEVHEITANGIVKTNDGYRTSSGIIVVFNVVYPKQLAPDIIEKLKTLEF